MTCVHMHCREHESCMMVYNLHVYLERSQQSDARCLLTLLLPCYCVQRQRVVRVAMAVLEAPAATLRVARQLAEMAAMPALATMRRRVSCMACQLPNCCCLSLACVTLLMLVRWCDASMVTQAGPVMSFCALACSLFCSSCCTADTACSVS